MHRDCRMYLCSMLCIPFYAFLTVIEALITDLSLCSIGIFCFPARHRITGHLLISMPDRHFPFPGKA